MKKIFVLLSMFLSAGALHKVEADGKGTGLVPLTEKEQMEIEQSWEKVMAVRPNKLGSVRLQESLASTSLQSDTHIPYYTDEDEFVTYIGPDQPMEAFQDVYYGALPSEVDNSKLPCFPPIGDQRSLGSCVGWASTYYHATHEIGLLNGYNNKTSFQNVLSPKWTYNLLNNGVDGGLQISHSYAMLAQNGATSIVNLPYDSDYREWTTNQNHWISAIKNRLQPAKLVPFSTNQNLEMIKQTLNNGHIITFGTYVSSWSYTKVGNDNSNPYIGQKAVSRMMGRVGSHHMTIVGYNDNIWIDINGNGVVDAGEKGAFLVANSWGTDWGNKGFMWVAYDAFFTNSLVPGGNVSGRVPLGAPFLNNFVLVTPKAANYNPSIIAKFSVSQASRNDFGINAGRSSTSTTAPTVKFLDYALNHKGGNYAYDGTVTSTAQVGNFAVDLTDLLPAGSTAVNRYYLSIDDNQSGNPSRLLSYSLVDLVHNKEVACTQTPVSAEMNVINPYVDFAFTGTVENLPVVKITSPATGTELRSVATIAASASSVDGIDHVDFFIDSKLTLKVFQAPYELSVNTINLTNGPHTFTVVAYDKKGKSAQTSAVFNVNNQGGIYINCGGQSDVVVNGVTWKKDTYYSSSSWDQFPAITDPIYKNLRWGKTFNYTVFPIANGTYNVLLKFEEPRYKTAGSRVFSVAINGTKFLTNLDLFKVAGFQKPYDRQFLVNVINNQIKIELTTTAGNAIINGFAITPR